METSDLTLHSKPVYVNPDLDSDKGYTVHPDVYDVMLQGYQCIRDMPDRIAEIANLYKPRQHRSWITKFIFGGE